MIWELRLGGVILGSFAYQPFIAVPTAQAQILSPEQKAKLQAEYDQLQKEIATWQKVLDDTRAKKKTLTGDVTALDAQIKKAQKEIQQRTISITTLGSEIIQKTAAITTLEQKLAAGKESLAKLMREKTRWKLSRSRSWRSPPTASRAFLPTCSR